jgi:three-Cys-motif partner protein
LAASKGCSYGGLTKDNGNCTNPAPDDGLPVQCIGIWSNTDKHAIFRKYLSASGGPRSRYLPPRGQGGAAFIDLFAGPGRARIRSTGQLVNGSPLIALAQPVNFTRLVFCEVDMENAAALRARVPEAAHDRVTLIEGDCNEGAQLHQIVAAVPQYGLNVALVDPYSLDAFRFETIARLAGFKHMDLVLFFPVGEIRRNLDRHRATYTTLIDNAVGTTEWQPLVKKPDDATKLIRVFKGQLQTRFGYTQGDVRSAPIRSEGNVPLYHLIFASKHPKGDAIWESITRRMPSGQGTLF